MVQFFRGQWKDLTDMLDRYSIMYMEGLLLVPVVMFALFYPIQTLIGVGAVLLVAVVAFEIFEWVQHHPHHPRPRPSSSSWHYPL